MANNKSAGLLQEVDRLNGMIEILWERSEVQRQNDEFTPLSKSPFLHLRDKVRQYSERPISGRMINTPVRAYVINTADPLMRGRVKIYATRIHANCPEHVLPWANVISFFGGLEDQGSVFTPPSGSTVIVEFEGGDRAAPVVMGSIHNVTRGKGGFQMMEETSLWGGAPGRRTDAKNPGARTDKNDLVAPWRCESYGRPDGMTSPFRICPPHIYGFKSPEKHFVQLVDGDSTREKKGKRLVIQTSKGSVIFGKDDVTQSPSEIFENPYWDDFKDAYPGLKYSKKPLNDHTIELKHTGWQVQSVGGGRLIISDEVEKDIFSNEWDTGFQISGRLRTFVALESITGHQVVLRESEKTETIRKKDDGIFMISACGNFIGLRDDTIGKMAGIDRGILLWSTSDHTIEMNDYTARNASPRSPSGGVKWRKGKPGKSEMDLSPGNHTPNATEAFIRIRSGWGQIIELNDKGSQEENATQFILIRNENKETGDCDQGPAWNFIRMECVVSNKLIHIWGAGDYFLQVCTNILRIVHKRNDTCIVEKGNYFVFVEKGRIFCKAQVGITHWTVTSVIMLLVGEITDDSMEFPPHPVIIAKDPFTCPLTGHLHFDTPSAHVFASE